MVAYYFGNHEVQELFGEFRIEPGILGQRSQPGDLFGFPYGVGRRQAMRRFKLTDLLCDLETLGEERLQHGGHLPAFSRPRELAARLEAYRTEQ